ncbi:MAG: hypothetical protein LM589_02540 [Thermosphaera sp.]|jgi:hypothetical protein|nr:hypothetical protein [Thermosphaera sp.]
MAIYRPGRDKRKLIEDALRDLDPGTRELARRVIENMLMEEKAELTSDELLKRIEEVKKRIKK